MHLYEQLVEPTVVTHSLICKLDPHSAHSNLIAVRGASLLQVYTILPAPSHYTIPALAHKLLEFTGRLEPSPKRSHLVLEAEWPLDGHLTGLDRLVVNGLQLLALSFRYAKIVLLEWILDKHMFRPVSLHYYEKQLVDGHYRDLEFPAQLTVEPKSKCLSLWYQRDMFSVLSFPDLELEKDLGENINILQGSTILEARNLGTDCRNIVDMRYLNGYNGPTLGVLFEQKPTWTGSLPVEKDSVTFQIISVDIERKSSTTIFSVDNLPYDIHQIVPLHSPVHGSLLVGSNCLIYVETNGRTMIYAVNKFAQLTSNATFIDNSRLGLDLAGCKVAHLSGTSHAIVATSSGELFELNFAVDGLKVFGITLEKVPGCPTLRNPNSIAVYGDTIFVACDSTSILLKYELVYQQQQQNQPLTPPQDEEFEGVYPEDRGITELKLYMDDALLTLGPITGTTVIEGSSFNNPSTFCVAFGGDSASGVACLRKGLWPSRSLPIDHKFSRFWTAGSFFLGTSASRKESYLYHYPSLELKQKHLKTEKVYTLAFASTSDGFYWHIHSQGFDIYDQKWELKASVELEAPARSATISGKYAIVCSEDTTLTLYSLHGSKVQNQEVIGQSKRYHLFENNIVVANNAEVAISSVHEPLQQEKYNFLDLPQDIKNATPMDTDIEQELKSEISEILLAEIGDSIHKQLVLVLTIEDVVTVYSFEKLQKVFTAPMFGNLGLHAAQLGEFSVIVAGGTSSFTLFKGHKSPIRLRPIRTNKLIYASSIGPELLFVGGKKQLERVSLEPGWDYTNLGWPVAATPVGETISCIAYNDTAEVLVVGTNTPHEREEISDGAATDDAKMVDEGEQPEKKQEQEPQEDRIPRCNTFKSSLKVINPETLHVTDSVDIGNETILCMRSVRLEIGVNTDQYKEFLVLGTSLLLDEDNVSNGHFYVFSVAEIVPDAERPEVRHRVKEVSKELCAGAVTAVYPVMGKLAVAQGQHLFIKAVQEDHTVDPIAFCDLEVYVSDLKCVRNLIAVADAYRSTNLVNFGNEPNRLDVISKDIVGPSSQGATATECVSSDLRQDLHLVSCDREGRVKILQYDPDNVQAMGGPKLVPQSHFYIGAVINSMTMVYGVGKDLGAIGGTNFGGLVSIMPQTEDAYRALYVVWQELMDKEQPFACLNERAHFNMNCQGGETLAIYGPGVNRFWSLDRGRQLSYSRTLGRQGIEGILRALTVDPLDYF